MQWTLDKYNRLADTRNMPMMVERGPFEQLFLQFDYPLKMLFVYHNGSQLETFLLHPLVFPHDLVRKDQRILFCIKSQSEGTISMKFRVRFSTVDSVNNFCAAVGKFIGVKAFDEWNCRSSSPFSVDLNNSSIMSNNRSFADPDLSTSSISLLNSFSQSSKISSQDNPPFDFSQPLAGQRKLVDTCTQTDGDEENVAPNRSLASLLPPSLPSSSSSSVHLHVENLFSTEAVHAFGGVLRQLVNGGSGNGNVNGNRKVETRAQKKKKKANETMKPPKRPLNSYMLWNGVNVKRSSQEWRSLPAEEKEHWKLCAAVGRIRYKDQMEALQKNNDEQMFISKVLGR